MSKVAINESTLTAIGDAIRAKTGKTDLIAPGAMPTEIESIETGGGELPEEAFVVSGDCQCRFAFNGWNWFINKYGNQIITKDIYSMLNMFTQSHELQTISFEINAKTNFPASLNYMFDGCVQLTSVPKINNLIVTDMSGMFNACASLKNIPADFANWFDWSYFVENEWGGMNSMFNGCHSLRTLPVDLFEHICPRVQPWYTHTYQNFYNCRVLDELTDLPLVYSAEYMDNIFYEFCSYCNRLKNLTFATDNGTPYTKTMTNQTIDLSTKIGFTIDARNITNYGIAADKEVKDDATYQALKNDPDWFTCNVAYSRYNHDSAVETINSLPDTSAYLATVGGTNTIQFTGASGELTDGGAINTLTEEEIAVATAKGWTVSLV